MPDIVLTTLNAKYAHAAFGLRYLLANLGQLQARAQLLEFDVSRRPIDVVEQILAQEPRIIGLGVYIWNVEQATILAGQLKRVRPDIVLVLGGPEVSYETDQQEITRWADYVICGEADLAFAELCQKLLAGERPADKVIHARLPEFGEQKGSELGLQGPAGARNGRVGNAHHQSRAHVAYHDAPDPSTPGSIVPITQDSGLSTQDFCPSLILPYHLYTDDDIRHRVVYVEASRGCPFRCEFCLSSLDVPVRNVPVEAFLAQMQTLLDRGLLHFKFVDRTFNLNLQISRAILEFFLERLRPGLFLHFEMIPDRLPDGLRGLIERFPPGTLQFEVGIQTFNEEVAARISRRQDNARVEQNLRFLRERTGVHVHADLIVGLPGEDIASFAAGFDRLVALGPQEIQVGMLKRLRGTPIARHDQEWAMVYSPAAPYEVLKTRVIDFGTMQRLRRFARYWDLLANSGNFRDALPMLWGTPEQASSFWRFMDLSDRLYDRMGRNHGIALVDLAEFLFSHLTVQVGREAAEVAAAIWADYQRGGRSDRPGFLRPFIGDAPIPRRGEVAAPRGNTLARQRRHGREG